MDLFVLIDFFMLGAGIYFIISAVRMITQKVIPVKILLPKEKQKFTCSDVDGYIAYMKYRFLAVAILVTAGSVLVVLSDFVTDLGVGYFIGFVMVLGSLIYLAVISGKSAKTYY